jgi:hypothetical protein
MSKARVLSVVLAVVALVVPLAAQAAGPIILRLPIDDVEVVPFCGFPMEIQTTGTAVVHLFLDEAGAFERVIITSPRIRLTFTNLSNGKSVWTPSVNMVVQSQAEGSSRTSSYRGLLWHLIVPGQGLITADVGKLDVLITMHDDGTFTEEVTFVAGQQEGAFLPLLCATLQ